MFERLPVSIDPFRLAETGRELKGVLPVAALKRLAPQLEERDGDVRAELHFGVDEGGVRYARGEVSAELTVVCQRCLQPVRLPVRAAVSLGLVRSEAEAARLPPTYEPLVVESTPMPLSELIEDELLLSLPLVPMHPEQECPGQEVLRRRAAHEREEEGRQSPFAALAKLKSKRE